MSTTKSITGTSQSYISYIEHTPTCALHLCYIWGNMATLLIIELLQLFYLHLGLLKPFTVVIKLQKNYPQIPVDVLQL